ncbi:hypothetical protein Tco_1334386 [Tanacetum coccineum]
MMVCHYQSEIAEDMQQATDFMNAVARANVTKLKTFHTANLRKSMILMRMVTETGTDNQEKNEKQSQNNKTGLGMEKTVKDKAKSKPESQSSQKVNRKVNWSKSKSTQGNPEAKVKEI